MNLPGGSPLPNPLAWLDGKLNLNNIEQSLKSLAQQLASLQDGLTNGSLSIAFLPGTTTAFSASQVTVDTSADLLVASNSSRKALGIINTGSVTVYIGASGVTASTGWPVAAGAQFTMDTLVSTAAIYGITASSSAVVAVLEL